MRVEEILNRDVVSIAAGETVHVALQTMAENRVGTLPVLDQNDRCVGMISATDLISLARELDEGLSDMRLAEVSRQWLIEHLAEQDMDRRSVTELMSTQVETTTPKTPLVNAARIMLRNQIHRLPVVNESGRLVGLVSMSDILAAFVDNAP
jgi:CBS domain-containing protein